MTKAIYRKKHLKDRKQMDFKAVNFLSNKIMDRLLNVEKVKKAERFFAYMSFKNEVDCYKLQAYASDLKKVYCVPKVSEDFGMNFHRIVGFNDLSKGRYNISEPNEDCPITEAAACDVVIVPGVVFSKDGYRIGYGGGYYDRYMALHPDAFYVGVSFDHQIEDAIPIESFDMRMDCIVTESQTYMYSKNTQ